MAMKPHTLKVDLTKYAADSSDNIPTHLKRAKITKEEFIVAQIDRVSSLWWIYFLNYDPAPTLEKVTCAVRRGKAYWRKGHPIIITNYQL